VTGTNRLFVVEQDGVIRTFKKDPGREDRMVFLDLRCARQPRRQ
jgi:hypothetical protein